MRELIDALESVARGDARVVVIRALGPAFSAGHDLREMLSPRRCGVPRDIRRLRALMTLLQAIPQPVIAEVAGIATAAGCQLVASCDLAIACDGREVRDAGRADRFVLHDADGRADARDRPQTRDGDAADRRLHRCADGRRVGPDQPRGPARPARDRGHGAGGARSLRRAASSSVSARRRSIVRSTWTRLGLRVCQGGHERQRARRRCPRRDGRVRRAADADVEAVDRWTVGGAPHDDRVFLGQPLRAALRFSDLGRGAGRRRAARDARGIGTGPCAGSLTAPRSASSRRPARTAPRPRRAGSSGGAPTCARSSRSSSRRRT